MKKKKINFCCKFKNDSFIFCFGSSVMSTSYLYTNNQQNNFR